MKQVKKLITFLKKNKVMERYNKDKNKWEEVELDLGDEETFGLVQTMSAELDIMVTIEEMELGIKPNKSKMN
jgi:hypothetical protein|tara:strand:+ start:4996 stop:5211 length:216 start_codon:yes stop_codon:yes gene_type:complete